VKLGRLKTFIRTRSTAGTFDRFPDGTLAQSSEWHLEGIAELRGIADAPTMRATGAWCRLGLRRRERAVPRSGRRLAARPDRPSKSQAARALKALLRIHGIPLRGRGGASGVRRDDPRDGGAADDFHLARDLRHRPSAGAGKTLLVVRGDDRRGRVAPKRMLPTEDDEVRKVITSASSRGSLYRLRQHPRGTSFAAPRSTPRLPRPRGATGAGQQ